MSFSLNPHVTKLPTPAIPTIASWAQNYDNAAGDALWFSQAAPGYPPHARVLHWLSELSKDASTCHYGDIEGEPTLRIALAHWMQGTYNTNIQAETIQITAGCNQAFAAAMHVIAQKGDTVGLIEPYYFNHLSTLESMGVSVQTVLAQESNGFIPSLNDVEALLKGGNIKALVLISPNNPTGAIYSAELLEHIADLCLQYGCWLILDETYRDFLAQDTVPHTLFSRPNWQDYIISLYSFSKSFCLPGYRVGALIAGTQFQHQVGKVMDNWQICAPRLPQLAIAQALSEPEVHTWLHTNQVEISARAQTMLKTFSAYNAQCDAKLQWTIGAIGAYFAYVKHPYSIDSMQLAQQLAQQCGLITIPGMLFGKQQQAYLRIAFANADTQTIEQIIPRITRLQLNA